MIIVITIKTRERGILDDYNFAHMPWNIKRIATQLKDFCIDTNDFYICTEITIDNKPNLLTQFLTIYIFSAIKDDGKKHSNQEWSIEH